MNTSGNPANFLTTSVINYLTAMSNVTKEIEKEH